MNEFKSDDEIIYYIEKGIEDFNNFNENRLHKEEQLQLNDEVFRIRNCIEWIIRINRLVDQLKYALRNSLEYAKKVENPMKKTKENDMYSYYLEDAVYRDIVLWDMLKQLMNEYYECGYKETDQESIFRFLKNKVTEKNVGKARTDNLLNYLNSKTHQYIRNELRNSFAHSVDGTLPYYFHKKNDAGLIQPQIDYLIPKHPYENICYIIDDIKFLNKEINDVVYKVQDIILNEIMIVDLKIYLECGIVVSDKCNISFLKEMHERIGYPCNKDCTYSNDYNGSNACKPKLIKYCRIYEDNDKYKGELKPSITFEEIKKIYSD